LKAFILFLIEACFRIKNNIKAFMGIARRLLLAGFLLGSAELILLICFRIKNNKKAFKGIARRLLLAGFLFGISGANPINMLQN